jgi:hypothetical protein
VDGDGTPGSVDAARLAAGISTAIAVIAMRLAGRVRIVRPFIWVALLPASSRRGASDRTRQAT